jgi:tetratricopeptide (TPR) repeat protein
MRRHSEAIAEVKKAIELDALSTPINNYLGETYVYAGEYQEASKQFQYTIDLDPTFPLAHFFFAENLMAQGKYEQAVQENEKGQLLNGTDPRVVAMQTTETLKSLRTSGSAGYWRIILEKRLKDYERSNADALDEAGAFAQAGERDNALEWLQKAFEEREDVTLIGVDPVFKNLQGDPRFSACSIASGCPIDLRSSGRVVPLCRESDAADCSVRRDVRHLVTEGPLRSVTLA